MSRRNRIGNHTQPVRGMILASALALSTGGCVTKAGPGIEDPLKISDSPGPDVPLVVPARQLSGVVQLPMAHGVAPAGAGKKKGVKPARPAKPDAVAWFSCLVESPFGGVLVFHDEGAGFDPKEFCKSSEAQSFLASGFHVVGFNRPGFEPSGGERDLAGKKSQEAAVAVANEVSKDSNGGVKSIVGAYGYGTGASAAAFFAKQSGTLRWLILGGGLYDFEQAARTSSDSTLVELIKKSAEKEGEVAYETRSIAYDVAGLPPRVAIFRGKDDTVAPHDQAHAFRDGLAASECKVTFQEIAGIGHAPGHRQLRQILDVMITSVR